MTAHLSANGLECRRGRTTILAGVDLDVATGERVAIVGPNGAGKSTLLRVLAAIDAPHAGTVLLDGQPLSSMPARERARAIAIVSQQEVPPADLLVHELVSLGRVPHRSAWSTDSGDHASSALDRLGLRDFADRPVDRLSGGELRRVLVARALAQEAPLLVLDEPTNHLDLRHQHELLRTVRDLGLTVVAAIHDLGLAARYFDRVVVVHDGGIAAAGAADEILTPDLVHRVFGVRVTRVTHPETGEPHLLVDP
ncbi:ABC transporter ATP-binding protein [Aeromicrobium alkaliterrae]|uniref:ABC transporter ATP-binding protein n=1 Tax=Aeromicrobium alkaliterrae TaxID=302168 RepID=A0ABN2JXQ6_9ACTN